MARRAAWRRGRFALNEMLRRYQAQLDSAFDFRALVLPVGSGQTLMRPPIVSAAQMAFALGDGGQVARETSCIYQITREAQLASTPPNWRIYLVRVWADPQRPTDGALPRTKQEVAYWNKWVAEGWAQGEKQAVDIFLSDLGRLRARHRGHGPLPGPAARRPGRAADASPSRTARSMAGATACMSAIDDPHHRPARAAGQSGLAAWRRVPAMRRSMADATSGRRRNAGRKAGHAGLRNRRSAAVAGTPPRSARISLSANPGRVCARCRPAGFPMDCRSRAKGTRA